MRRVCVNSGFTLVELMTALGLLSAVALGLTTTLISTQKALTASEKWMQAAQLAAEALEQLRAGQIPGPGRSGFERTTAVGPWPGHPGLRRLEVRVAWNDGTSHTYQLVTLARR
jgi:prepilin-type N-terminal cleavage/methylation domain-containing protein